MKLPRLPVPHAPSRRTVVATITLTEVVTVAVATKLGLYPLAAGAASGLIAQAAYLAGRKDVKR